MVIYKSFNNEKLADLVKRGGIGVIPTDTVYGIICSVFDKDAVEKIYEIKGRNEDKPFIILIPNLKSLSNFGVQLSENQKEFLEKNWPGKLSAILPVGNEVFSYLTRGKGSLAFRMPADNKLCSFLEKVGPVVAPSANPQDMTTAKNVDDVMNYFIGKIDFVVDGGDIEGVASTLVDFTGSEPMILRQGEVEVK